MSYEQTIASLIQVQTKQVAAAIELLDGGNTLPFIARYRKEVTGGLDEEQLRTISEEIERLRTLDERRETILASIETQGKLTDELREQILAADTKTTLEDLYLPYKPKRRTRASIAREKGLEGLAQLILTQTRSKLSEEELAQPYLNDQVTNTDDALSGARDIVAEMISDNAEVRRILREKAWKWGTLTTQKTDESEDPRKVYELYYQFEHRVDTLRPHQVLAIQRGEKEKVLRISVAIPERDWQNAIGSVFRGDPRSSMAGHMAAAIDDAAERLLLPSIERDVRRELQEKAETHAILVFSSNLKGLLQQPPLGNQVVLGIDPGFRTGCKIAIVDPTGKVLDTGTIYPHEPQKAWSRSLDQMKTWIKKFNVTLISIGNGTASRESEQLVAELIRDMPDLQYIITSEAGASVYSASPLARSEFPNLDVSIRGAVSIARRIQDPLAELVKIDPKSIGVGLYQHDVDQSQLSKALTGVVESVVNQVGVNVNTASPSLLTYVAGIGPKLAESIVQFRDDNGAFRTRTEIKKVPGFGPKAFEQSAGFLRVLGGDQPFDASAIHPESYTVAQGVLAEAQISFQVSPSDRKSALDQLVSKKPLDLLADQLSTGEPTLIDILEQLVRPGRDPREDCPPPILRRDVLSMEDLVVGMQLKGTVRNVVDFGAFVDIGVKQDGLLHRSQLPQGVVLEVGDIIDVEIQRVEIERGRIGLTWGAAEED